MIESVTFSVDVPDLEEAVEFYSQGLGFSAVGQVWEDAFELRGAGVRVDLLERAAGTAATPGDDESVRAYDRHWTPVHLDLEVEDVESAVERAVDAGATLESGPTSFDGETIATCSDPFGNGFCLIEPAEL